MKLELVKIEKYLFVFLCIVSAYVFTKIYFESTYAYMQHASMARLTKFTADKPFQFRILIPAAAHLIREARSILPVKIYHIYFFFTFLFTAATVMCFSGYLKLFIPAYPAKYLALLIYYPMACNYWIFTAESLFYPSDIPAICFFLIGLIAIKKEKWNYFYLVFIIGNLNRETACFLSFAYLFTMAGRHSPARLAANLSLQLLIWIAIKTVLYFLFLSNPGNAFGIHIGYNGSVFASMFQFEFNRRVLAFMGSYGFVWIFIPLFWEKQPVFFKKALLTVIPFYAGMAIVSVMTELRVYNEMIPLLTAPAVFSIYQFFIRKNNSALRDGN